MSIRSDQLLALRQHEQESKGYAPSSRWYTYLSYAINHLDLAETAANPIEQFRNAWSAIYNLYMMNHQAGEMENLTLSNWVNIVNSNPLITQLALEMPPSLLQALQKANKDLLVDAERQKRRDAAELVDSWLAKQSKNQPLSPQKACSYLFMIGRDLRNALSHPTLNPNKKTIQSVFDLAGPHFLRVAEAAIRMTIEHPSTESTGRVNAYRFFLYPYLKNSDSFLSDYYLERLLPDAELAVFADDAMKTTIKALAQARQGARETLLRDLAGDITRQQWCEQVLFPVLGMNATTGTTIVGAKGVYNPDYVIATTVDVPASNYQGRAAGKALQCLLWVLPWREPLDSKAIDGDFAGLTMTEMAHQALVESDVPWAILTNGQQLRLLHQANAHKPRSFLEADLSSILNNPTVPTARQAFRYLLGFFSYSSFVEVDNQDQSRLDRILAESERHGKEIGEELKENVFKALEELGEGFLYIMRGNHELVQRWLDKMAAGEVAIGISQVLPLALTVEEFLASDELLQTIYQESLALLYRLLFLFYAESRDLLPMESGPYRESYSLESIRDDIIKIHDSPDRGRAFFSKGAFELADRLTELFRLVDEGFGNLIPAYNGGLFDPEKHPFLAHFTVGDQYMAKAIDFLSRTRPRRGQVRGEGRKKVTYRDLDVRHLGSIYEGLLEYSAHIAREEQIIFERSQSGSKYEEYVASSELSASERKQLVDYRQALDENDEFPNLPTSCKVRGTKETGQYFLVFGGKDSKRKSSGSYYTPDYIVQYIVENTLGPLVRGENREGDRKDVPRTAAEILELKVLDPAMGSGHFLVAATEYLARAYGQALIREGQDRDGVMDDAEFIRYKRLVAERCIYGVDINPMAVELAKLSMWLFTMDKQRPLSFLDHHLKDGNALIGAEIRYLADLPRFDRRQNWLRPQNNAGQLNLFEYQFLAQVPIMVGDVLQIMEKETVTHDDIVAKKALNKAISDIKEPYQNIANAWITAFLGHIAADYTLFVSRVESARDYHDPYFSDHRYLHWEIELPEVWFDQHGRHKEQGGFDAIIGNPPYLRIQGIQEHHGDVTKFLRNYYHSAVKRYDLYLLFMERGFELLAPHGRLCFICSHKFTNADFGSGLREYLIQHSAIKRLISFGNNQIFENATTYTGLVTLQKDSSQSKFDYLEFPDMENSSIPTHLTSVTALDYASYDTSSLSSAPWILVNIDTKGLVDIVTKRFPQTLEETFESIFQGVVTGVDDIYFLDKTAEQNDDIIELFSPREARSVLIESAILKPMLKGEDLFRYGQPDYNCYCIYPYKVDGNRTVILEEDELSTTYPYAYEYLKRHQTELRRLRVKFKTNPHYWYSCHRSRSMRAFERDRIITPEISLGCNMTLSPAGVYHNTKVYSLLPKDSTQESIFYWLGVLNSQLMWWFISNTGYVLRGGYYAFKTNYLKPFPLRTIDFAEIKDVAKHDQVATYAKEMLSLHSTATKNSSGNSSLQRQIVELDHELNTLVYDLYELSKQEREIIQKS